MLTPPRAALRPSELLARVSRAARGDASGRRRAARRAIALAVLAAVVALAALAGAPRPTRHLLAPDPAPPLAALLRGDRRPPTAGDSAPAPLDAYLVTSVRDCASNLGALDLLAREAIAPRIRLAAALVVVPRQLGDARATHTDSSAIRTVREAIAARGLPIPEVRALDPATALLLRRIGYRSTPFLVVLDSAGALRFAMPPSLSFTDYRHLAHTLAALAGETH